MPKRITKKQKENPYIMEETQRMEDITEYADDCFIDGRVVYSCCERFMNGMKVCWKEYNEISEWMIENRIF